MFESKISGINNKIKRTAPALICTILDNINEKMINGSTNFNKVINASLRKYKKLCTVTDKCGPTQAANRMIETNITGSLNCHILLIINRIVAELPQWLKSHYHSK